VRTFVFYLALGMAVGGQLSPQTPQSQPSQEQPVHSKLSRTELSDLKAKAEKGDASAQFALGKAYEEGNGVPKSDESAVKWYRKAADQGNAPAETSLGIMYRLGQGVNRDKEEAVRWYRKAAKQGNPQAMFNLGVSYYNGDGVSSDPNLAYAWFLLAQDAGNTAADDAVKRSAEEGGRLGTPDALQHVAAMYEKGDELPQSYPQAAKWYRKAADVSPEAAVRLASMYIEDRGVLQDYGQAMTLCKSAAKAAYSPAQYCVGYLYRRGLGTQADPKEAAKWYDLAGQGGQRQALMELAEMYWKGEGVGADRPQAYYYFFLAHRRGAPDARTRAQMLRKEMSTDEITRLEKKLEKQHYLPRDVFAYMQDLKAPEAPKEPGRR
jgi:TPR repeat protein